MKSYFDILKVHIEAHPPNYGDSDIQSILEMLWNTYCQHNQLDSEQIKAALENGKHIMCEKPLALTRDDLVAMVNAVKAHPECKFMIGQICRFTPAFVQAKSYP